MKIKEFVSELGDKYNNKLKIIKKGIFRISLDEDAFFLSKSYNMKITILDKETIKVGFPDGSKNKWLNMFRQKNLSYYLFEKKDNNLDYTMVVGQKTMKVTGKSGITFINKKN